jgi:hypothetical protein
MNLWNTITLPGVSESFRSQARAGAAIPSASAAHNRKLQSFVVIGLLRV